MSVTFFVAHTVASVMMQLYCAVQLKYSCITLGITEAMAVMVGEMQR